MLATGQLIWKSLYLKPRPSVNQLKLDYENLGKASSRFCAIPGELPIILIIVSGIGGLLVDMFIEGTYLNYFVI